MRCGRRESLVEIESNVIFLVSPEANKIEKVIVTDWSGTELKIKIQSVLFVKIKIKCNVMLCFLKQTKLKRLLSHGVPGPSFKSK
jgi:hypothetical protein